ncbi:MAG: hypothetical protein KDH09_17265 [Chrysiogenetes bacterium]|nr:hypothetical protein [Chrysiogenetes bacterium]
MDAEEEQGAEHPSPARSYSFYAIASLVIWLTFFALWVAHEKDALGPDPVATMLEAAGTILLWPVYLFVTFADPSEALLGIGFGMPLSFGIFYAAYRQSFVWRIFYVIFSVIWGLIGLAVAAPSR